MKLSDIKKLGIIAGSGYLPFHVYESCHANNIPYCIIGLLKNTSSELFTDIHVDYFKIYSISKIIKKLKDEGVTHITLAGKVKRAEIAPLLMDLKGAKLFAQIIKSGFSDNAILKTILSFIEKEGFNVVAPEQIATQIIIGKGCLTKSKPDASAQKDIKQGIKVLRGIASYDVGQSLVIQNGLILGVEAAEGTDNLIKRCGKIRQQEGEAPVLIKIAKPLQDKRVDLPCIGPETIENAHQFGIRGIAVEAGSTLILEQKQTIKLANTYKMFIIGV